MVKSNKNVISFLYMMNWLVLFWNEIALLKLWDIIAWNETCIQIQVEDVKSTQSIVNEID